jgi:hypothetical protein
VKTKGRALPQIITLEGRGKSERDVGQKRSVWKREEGGKGKREEKRRNGPAKRCIWREIFPPRCLPSPFTRRPNGAVNGTSAMAYRAASFNWPELCHPTFRRSLALLPGSGVSLLNAGYQHVGSSDDASITSYRVQNHWGQVPRVSRTLGGSQNCHTVTDTERKEGNETWNLSAEGCFP